jgi:hypothetical protein
MTNCWRLIVCAAALMLTVNSGTAVAQTVIVRKAPPGSTVELVLNAATVATATVDSSGVVTLAVNLVKNAGKTETDASLFYELCGDVRRVVIVERGVTPPTSAGCDRRELAGLFLLRGITSVVLDVSTPTPLIRLRQGRPPDEWLRDEVPGGPPPRTVPTGLVLSGGAGLGKASNAVGVACGTVTDCSGDDFGLALNGSAAVWLSRFVGAEVSYLRPAKVKANGSGTNFRFDSTLDTHVINVFGKVGAPAGPVRLYAQAGPTYHRGTFKTSQTTDEVTVTEGDVTRTIPGGTQTFVLQTSGWTWALGGGLEGWVSGSAAIYAEFMSAGLNGRSRSGGEGSLDDRVTLILFGIRVHLGP